MITIYAEKPDVGSKIAAALDKITLSAGKTITFADLKKNEKVVKAQQAKDGFLKIHYLGEDCIVTWGYGHLGELKQAIDYNPDYKNWSKMPMPFIPSEYEIKVKDNVKKQFNLVKGFFTKSSMIINATDDDREGDLIFDYVYRLTKTKAPFKRVHMASQTKEGLEDAFAHLLTPAEVKNRTDAGNGRSIADAVVGWNLTTKMTLQNKSRDVLSIGRVQTPTLNILVKREKEILAFKPEPYYTIMAEFTTDKGDKYKGAHKLKKIDKKSDAEDILNRISGHKGTVTDIKKENIEKSAPNLYNLSTLQMAANGKYGFTLAKTLELAQQLYEGGYITYPRTTSQYLTEDMEPTINAILNTLEKASTYEKYIVGKPRKFNRSKYFNDKKVESHYAIIPTKTYPFGLTTDQEKIYDLVAKSVIMMLYGAAKLEKTTVTTTVEGEDFISNGNIIVDPQWMLVDSATKEEILPDLKNGQIVDGIYKMEEKETQPPKRYTDKTLLSAMISAGKSLTDEELKKILSAGEDGGIGTPATRAAIIDTLIKRGYAERNGKNIAATAKGISLIDALPIEAVKSAEMTARWEQRLNKIEKGEDSLTSFVHDIEGQTKEWVSEIGTLVEKHSISSYNVSLGKCPSCGKDIIKTKWGYGCSGYKDGCKFTISGKIAGKTITEAQVKTLLSKGKTSYLKGFTSKAGKQFQAALVLNEKYQIEFQFPDFKKK